MTPNFNKRNRKYPQPQPGDKINDWEMLEFICIHNCAQIWECRCKCGREFDVNLNNILTGKSKGCKYCAAKKKKGGGPKAISSVGKKIGLLAVVDEYRGEDGNLWVKCECSGCNNKDYHTRKQNISSYTYYIKNTGNHYIGCGCLRISRYLPPYVGTEGRKHKQPQASTLEMAKMKLAGRTLREIANKFNISRQAVEQRLQMLPPEYRPTLEEVVNNE